MIEILYLGHNRVEFTRMTLAAMIAHTDWEQVSHVSFYDDESSDGTTEAMQSMRPYIPVRSEFVCGGFHSPVTVMNDFITRRRPELFAKIDNDTMLPAGWLGESLAVLDHNPEVDLLGLEAMFETVAVSADRRAVEAEYIGGIGLMRGRIFETALPEPAGRFGFTAFQQFAIPDARKAWMKPSLPVCLLDRVPFDPWCSFSGAYVAKGWQRPWTPYGAESESLWSWWR